MSRFDVTIRHGLRGMKYHTLAVDAVDIAEALRQVAEGLPPDVRETANLVELRAAPDAMARGAVE